MKGQAFSVFKLMIAAVVAVAILGILLSILGSITIPGQSPANMIRNLLGEAYNTPNAILVSQSKASFTAGVKFTSSTFKDAIGDPTCSIKYVVAGVYSDYAEGGDSLTIKSNFNAKIAVCCDKTQGCTCYVGIGENSLSEANVC